MASSESELFVRIAPERKFTKVRCDGVWGVGVGRGWEEEEKEEERGGWGRRRKKVKEEKSIVDAPVCSFGSSLCLCLLCVSSV